MRGHTLRNTAAGFTVVALFVVGTGCTSGGNVKADAASCAYAWSGIEREQKLTGLSEPITLKRKADSVSVPIDSINGVHYEPRMTFTAPGVRAADAIKALGRHLGTTEPLADPSEGAVPEETGMYYELHAGNLQGSYYAWTYVDLVEADFTYNCAGAGDTEPVGGHVLTWDRVGQGFLSCGDPVEDGDLGTPEAATRIAALKLCPADSPAAKTA
ncbi:hypothetical protein ACFWFF_37010 [Streptomyces sp. NPDC060223]|uniref:hypothetical protein n=1 Tax=unclassified Streptomyces TaxID=2593676 RepID=UPI00363201CF